LLAATINDGVQTLVVKPLGAACATGVNLGVLHMQLNSIFVTTNAFQTSCHACSMNSPSKTH
jgi:hypothetical protein